MKFNKITDKELNLEVKGQWIYEANNGIPYDDGVCGRDCLQTNYWWGNAPGHWMYDTPGCIKYGEYVSGQTWPIW